MDSTIKTRLEALLRQIQLLMSVSNQPSPSSELQQVFTNICKLVFDEHAYRGLWDEPILSQLNWLFQVKPSEPTIFGGQVVELSQRVQQAQRVNDFFFQILNRDASVEKVYEVLRAISLTEPSLLCCLKSSGRLAGIREADASPSEKITAFLDFLREDAGLDLANQEPVKGVLGSFQSSGRCRCGERPAGDVKR